MKKIAFGLGLLMAACSGNASVSVTDLYVIEPTGPNAAVYMDIDNPGDVDETLLGVTVEGFETQIHETRIAADGQASMQMLPRVVVRSGETLEMRPGGLHVMIMDAQGIAAGDEVTLTFDFDGTEEATVETAEVITIADYLEMIEAE